MMTGGRQALWSWAVAGLWLIVIPLACVVVGGAAFGSAARVSATRSAAGIGAATLAAVAADLGSSTPRSSTPPRVMSATSPVEPTATATAAAASVMPATSRPSPTLWPEANPTNTPTPTVTGTAEPTSGPATSAPDVLVIGTSVAGRPLTVSVFGTGPVARLIVAGIHGGSEWNTSALAKELIAVLKAEPERVPPDITLYVLATLNPDGAARGTGIEARANDHHVDLNRNWPSRWQADWSRQGCWKHLRLSGGTHAGSEPETQALMQFMLARRIDAVLNYHSAALGIFAGGQPPDAASLRLAEEVAAVSDYPWPPLDFGCVYTGQLIDWASEQGIAALDIELTNHRDTDLDQNLRILTVFLAWRR